MLVLTLACITCRLYFPIIFIDHDGIAVSGDGMAADGWGTGYSAAKEV